MVPGSGSPFPTKFKSVNRPADVPGVFRLLTPRSHVPKPPREHFQHFQALYPCRQRCRSTSAPSTTIPKIAPIAALAAALMLSPAAHAGQGTVTCVVPAGRVEGIETDALVASLAVELRKAGLNAEAVAMDDPRCVSAARRAGTSALVVFGRKPDSAVVMTGGRRQDVPLSDVIPINRVDVLARFAAAVIAGVAGSDDPQPLVDNGRALALPAPSKATAGTSTLERVATPGVAPSPREAAPTTGGAFVALGLRLDRELDTDVASPAFELRAGMATLNRRLETGLAFAALPQHRAGVGDLKIRRSALELRAFGSWGFEIGRITLGAGLYAGWQWRDLRVEALQSAGDLPADSGAALAGGGIELGLPLDEEIRVRVEAGARAYSNSGEHRAEGHVVYRRPRAAATVSAALVTPF